MRRGFLFALMVVLVLRGLTGTAMAAGMWPAPAAAATISAVADTQAPAHVAHRAAAVQWLSAAAEETATHRHHDHGNEQEAVQPCSEAPAPECTGHEHSLGTCTACDICHSAMLEAPVPHAPAEVPAGFALPGETARFASAPAALAIKPPIG